MRANSLRNLAAAGLMAFAAGLPALGQQTQIAVRPGSGVVLTRDRGYRHKPRVLDEAARAKHAAKMQRRYVRWRDGLLENPCVSLEQFRRLLGIKIKQ